MGFRDPSRPRHQFYQRPPQRRVKPQDASTSCGGPMAKVGAENVESTQGGPCPTWFPEPKLDIAAAASPTDATGTLSGWEDLAAL